MKGANRRRKKYRVSKLGPDHYVMRPAGSAPMYGKHQQQSNTSLQTLSWGGEGMGGEGKGWYVEMEEETLQHPCKCLIVPPWMG